MFHIRPIETQDQEQVRQFMHEHWYDERVIAHGQVYYPHVLPGFLALHNERWLGIITYIIQDTACEIVSLDSLAERRGIGTALIDEVSSVARQAGCTRLWLITSNDNLPALSFYQKRGFRLFAIHRNAIYNARRIKPSIPETGYAGIPICDEIELEMELEHAPVPC